jgi:hypothetical protein
MSVSEWRYMLGGKFVKLEDIGITKAELSDRFPVMALGDGLPLQDVVYLFDSEEAFFTWSKRTAYAEHIARIQAFVEEAQKHEQDDPTVYIERVQTVTERIRADLQKLSARTGLPLGSIELLKHATIESPILEGPIFHSALLYDQPNERGDTLGVVMTPNFGWVDWDDRASSILALGVGFLARLHWFRGHKVWFAGIPVQVSNLADLGFDKMARSASFTQP